MKTKNQEADIKPAKNGNDLHEKKELKTDGPLSEKDEVKKAEQRSARPLRKKQLL